MKKSHIMKRNSITTLIFVLLPFIGVAQEKGFIDLARTEVNFEKRGLVGSALGLESSESVEFWKIYSNFELEIDRLGDKRVANIKNLSDNAENMSDKTAAEIAKTYFSLQAERNKIYKKYYSKIKQVISVKKTVKFFQIYDQVQLLVDVQIAEMVPLIK